MEIKLNDSTVIAVAWICSITFLCLLTVAIWKYNENTVKMYTQSGYEEVSDKGTSMVYWRKAR